MGERWEGGARAKGKFKWSEASGSVRVIIYANRILSIHSNAFKSVRLLLSTILSVSILSIHLHMRLLLGIDKSPLFSFSQVGYSWSNPEDSPYLSQHLGAGCWLAYAPLHSVLRPIDTRADVSHQFRFFSPLTSFTCTVHSLSFRNSSKI